MLKYYNKTVDLLPFFFKDVIVNLYSFRACYLVYTSSKPLYNFHLLLFLPLDSQLHEAKLCISSLPLYLQFLAQSLILKKYSINICLMNARINEIKDKDEKAGWSL